MADPTLDDPHLPGTSRAGAALARLETVSKWVTGAVTAVAATLIVLTMVVTLCDVIGRKFFDRPVSGTIELTEVALVCLVYLGMASAQRAGDHVSIDLLYDRLGPRGKLLLRGFATSITLTVLGLIIWRVAEYAEVLEVGNYVTANYGIPLYEAAWVVVIGLVAFGIAAVASIFRPRDEESPL